MGAIVLLPIAEDTLAALFKLTTNLEEIVSFNLFILASADPAEFSTVLRADSKTPPSLATSPKVALKILI